MASASGMMDMERENTGNTGNNFQMTRCQGFKAFHFYASKVAPLSQFSGPVKLSMRHHRGDFMGRNMHNYCTFYGYKELRSTVLVPVLAAFGSEESISFSRRKASDIHVDLSSLDQSHINPNDLRPAVIYHTLLPTPCPQAFRLTGASDCYITEKN